MAGYRPRTALLEQWNNNLPTTGERVTEQRGPLVLKWLSVTCSRQRMERSVCRVLTGVAFRPRSRRDCSCKNLSEQTIEQKNRGYRVALILPKSAPYRQTSGGTRTNHS